MPTRKTDYRAGSMGMAGPRRGAMRRRWVVAGAAALALVVVAGAVLLAMRPRSSAANGVSSAGVQHSAASTGLIVGPVAALDLTRAYAGKVVVVNYMATWCTACQAEVPGLVKTFDRFRDRGVQLVGVSLQTSRGETRAMIGKLGIDYPVYLDSTGAAATQRFHLLGMPTTLVFKDGRLIRRFDGEISGARLGAYLETVTG